MRLQRHAASRGPVVPSCHAFHQYGIRDAIAVPRRASHAQHFPSIEVHTGAAATCHSDPLILKRKQTRHSTAVVRSHFSVETARSLVHVWCDIYRGRVLSLVPVYTNGAWLLARQGIAG